MAMSHLFGCMDCPPCPEPFWDMENLESDMRKICPSSAKSICYFSVCHWVISQGSSPARPRPDLRYLGTWKSRFLEVGKSRFLEVGKSRFLEVGKCRFLGPGNPEIWGPKNKKKHKNSQNSNPFCPKCRQGLD